MINFTLFQTERVYRRLIDENSVKFSERIENTVGKQEIALVTSNLFFSHSVFKRLLLQTCRKPGLVSKRGISFPYNLEF